MTEPNVKGQGILPYSWLEGTRVTGQKHGFREEWTIEAKFAISLTGSKGSLIFKAHDRYFQTALQKAWNDSANGMRNFTVSQFSLLLLILGVIHDFSSWLFWLASLPDPLGYMFALRVDSSLAEHPHICSSLWSTYPLHPASSAHSTLYLCWPALRYLEYPVIRKNPSLTILSQQVLTTYLLTPPPIQTVG